MALRVCILILGALLTGCATQPSDGRWLYATKKAASDSLTWAPVATAVLVSASGADDDIAEWAMDENPVFGSRANAERRSDEFKDILKGGALASTAFLPREAPFEKKYADFTAITLVSPITDFIKDNTDRQRPDKSDRRSFPSGHTSQAFTAARILSDNKEYYDLSDGMSLATDITIYSLAVGTGWARVEAGVHYPSDVLVGAALGNFFSVFLNEAFFYESDTEASVYIEPKSKTFNLGLSWSF